MCVYVHVCAGGYFMCMCKCLYVFMSVSLCVAQKIILDAVTHIQDLFTSPFGCRLSHWPRAL